MSPPQSSPISAPDLIGPNSILQPAWSQTGGGKRPSRRPYRHVRLEIDLRTPDRTSAPATPWARLESAFARHRVVESADLVRLTALTLHSFAAQGFRRVDHWEVTPGGWIEPPGNETGPSGEPVGQLISAVEGESGPTLAKARSFSLRLSRPDGNRADVVVRRAHRASRHSLTLDLWGTWTKRQVDELTGAIAGRLPVRHVELTRSMHTSG